MPDTTAAAGAPAGAELLAHVQYASAWAIAIGAVVAGVALLARGVKRSGRTVVLWMLAADLQERDAALRTALEGQVEALRDELAGVGEQVDFIAHTLIQRGLE